MSFLGCSSQGHHQAAGRQGGRKGAPQAGVLFKVSCLHVVEQPASRWREERIFSHGRLHPSSGIPLTFNQPLISRPDAKERKNYSIFLTWTAKLHNALAFLLSELVGTQGIHLFPPQREAQTFPFWNPNDLQQVQCSRIQRLGKESFITVLKSLNIKILQLLYLALSLVKEMLCHPTPL